MQVGIDRRSRSAACRPGTIHLPSLGWYS